MDNTNTQSGQAGPGTGEVSKSSGISPKHVLTIRNFMHIFTYASWLEKLILSVSFIAALAAGLTMPLMVVLFGTLVGDFTDFFKQDSKESRAEFIRSVNQCVLYIAYLFLTRMCLHYISNLGFRAISMRISAAIRLKYLESLFMMPISTLDMLPPGQTAAIITITASNLQMGISEKLASIFTSIMSVIAALVIALLDNFLLTCSTIVGLFFIGCVYIFTTPLISVQMSELHENNVSTSSIATEAFASARMVAACGAEQKMVDRHAALVERGRHNGVRMARQFASQHGLVFFGVYATFALAFWVAFQMYIGTMITSSESLIVVLLCMMIMASSIGQISAPVAAASQAADAYAIFHTIIDAPKTTYGTRMPPHVSADGDILFENINFVYPSRPEVKVLDNLSLHIPAGKVTAIVGPSGSGKSTLVAILQRWYEFNGDPVTNPLVLWLRNGQISVSGTKLSDIDVKWWRSQVGLVQQESLLFDTTIYSNVAAGLIGTGWEHAEDRVKRALVEQACKDAYAHEFISELPKGYQTSVGEFGLKLSGGQRQRLAIARAIVKRPSILILDEATSAIDVRSEQIVQAALDQASRGRTTIVIAHRLGTIQKADKIIVLQKGQVIEQGTHQELMAQTEGRYYSLATMQHLAVGALDDDPCQNDDMIESFDEKTAPHPNHIETATVVVGKEEVSYDAPDDNNEPTSFRASSARSSFDDTHNLLEENQIQIVEEQNRWLGPFGVLFYEQRSKFMLYILIIVAALGTGVPPDVASTPLQAYIFSNLVALFSLLSPELPAIVNGWCLAFFYLALGVGACYAILAWATANLGFHIMRHYRKELFSNIMNKPASFFDENAVGTLSARLATDPTQLHQLLGTNMASIIVSFFSLLGCVVIAFIFGWKLAAVAIGTSVPVIIAAMFYRVKLETKIETKGNAVFAESAKFASESITAIRTVSSLTMEDQIYQRYRSLLRTHVRGATADLLLPVLLFSLCENISLLCMGFVLWYGGQLLASHEYSPFQYMVVYIAVIQGGLNAGQWLGFASNIATARAAADRVIQIRDDDDGNDNKALGQRLSLDSHEAGAEKGAEIRFKDVWFSYPGRPSPVLKGLNLKIEKGQFVAIVGASGSGKTTIISLLERFYSAESGRIARNGLEISNTDLAAHRASISLVAQEPCLFSGSIRDNILLGVPDETFVDEEEIHQACKDAGIHEYVVSLPEGYDTEIGPRGVTLSGGQKQRISIARALIRHPSLVLLDEATSALDSETERAVQTVFEEMRGSTTMVVVAHRLATVRNADIIFVIGDGKVVEQGNHANLIAQKGMYAHMCQSQALNQ
ncbi:ABC transporter BEA3 [Paramyrothecium foliicola]|nr:ABC transporter BEA3 [Paramyrothecium foliicola]